MIRLIPLALLCALPACTTTGLPSAPEAVADRTILDKQGALTAELAYKAARLAVETGVDAGVIKGAAAAKFAVLDAKAYSALGVVRQAYRTGNAASYASALVIARSAITDLLSLAGKDA